MKMRELFKTFLSLETTRVTLPEEARFPPTTKPLEEPPGLPPAPLQENPQALVNLEPLNKRPHVIKENVAKELLKDKREQPQNLVNRAPQSRQQLLLKILQFKTPLA
jgi:hypothetical protein